MSGNELAIPREAVEAAAKALFDRDWLGAKMQPAWGEDVPESVRAERREEAETAIRAFCEVVGMTLEDRDSSGLPYPQEISADSRRLVSRWLQEKS